MYPLVTARAVARPFTYEVPDEAEKGAIVEVRFGNAKRRGVVTEVGVAALETHLGVFQVGLGAVRGAVSRGTHGSGPP